MERKRKQIYFASNIIYDADEIHKFHWTALKTLHILCDRGFANQNIVMLIISSKDVAPRVLPDLSKIHYILFPSLKPPFNNNSQENPH